MDQISVGTGCKNSNVFAAMGFGNKRDLGLLKIVRICRIDIREVVSTSQQSTESTRFNTTLFWSSRLIICRTFVPAPVRVTQRCIRQSQSIFPEIWFGQPVNTDLADQAQNIVSAHRITLNEHRVAVISGNDDESVVEVYFCKSRSNRIGKRDCIGQSTKGIAVMMSMVDTTRFNHQKISVSVLRKDIDGFRGHFRKRRLAGCVLWPVVFKLHIRRLEQGKKVMRLFWVNSGELLLVPNVGGILIF